MIKSPGEVELPPGSAAADRACKIERHWKLCSQNKDTLSAYEAAVMQHQSTEGNVVDFLRELPEVALQELFDYYYCNGDSYSTTTSTSTATNL